MKRWVYEKSKAVATKTGIVKPPKESRFFEKGQLTPEEFVIAGDQLVQSCPTWCWKKAAKGHINNYLPQLKQFLYTKVPCRSRIKDIMSNKGTETELDDGWHLISTEGDSKSKSSKKQQSKPEVGNDLCSSDSSDSDEEEKEEKAEVVQVKQQKTQQQESRSRYYELTITYDLFYFTPRMWLVGYKEDGTLLKDTEMFDDIMGDYQNKTVTLDPHPCLGNKQISIHPCKHASAMKHLIDMFLDNGGQLKVHQAMFVFLKFISSVVPTIEYDFTVNMSFA